MSQAMKIKPECPVRLRECLTALAAAAGTDVTRVEFQFTERGAVLFVTSSRAESEEAIAEAVLEKLSPGVQP